MSNIPKPTRLKKDNNYNRQIILSVTNVSCGDTKSTAYLHC